MSKVDKAISFVEDNYIMIDSIRCKDDDNDIVDYIIRILKHHKRDVDLQKKEAKP